MNLLEVDKLRITFQGRKDSNLAVDQLSFKLDAGQTLALVGESGSGKSQSMLALLGLLAANGQASGKASFDGQPLLGAGKQALRKLRFADIGMVFQNPMTALNPYLTVGQQLRETLRCGRREAKTRMLGMLQAVGLPEPAQALRRYPRQFSGGQQQRIMIAMALLPQPRLLIADEPTTALDVTVQAQILDLLRRLQREQNLALIFITHDLAVAASLCERIMVMRHGKLVEQGPAAQLLRAPSTDYSRALLACLPTAEREPRSRLPTVEEPSPAKGALRPSTPVETLLQVENLSIRYQLPGWRRRELTAVDHLSFSLQASRTLGIAGESGSGKSTVTRAIMGLLPLASGNIQYAGKDCAALDKTGWLALRAQMQIVFQDPFGALNPRLSIAEIIAEPLRVHQPAMSAAQRQAQAAALLAQVQLPGSMLRRYPHELSGGQCQRVAIARALAVRPRLLICDEAVSALDVSVQAGILNLLLELQAETGMAMLFVSHDLGVVRHVCDDLLIMRAGRLEEIGPAQQIFSAPQSAYTRALLAAIPSAI